MSSTTKREDREFEIILWGATGFTGKLTAQYLLERYGAGTDLRWALAGRNAEKLESVRAALTEETGIDASALPLRVGDSQDASFLADLARSTRVVCSTVGPYARYGGPLVEACANAGTDYCDLTGEVPWMRKMITQHEAAARESGARIVHNCGFDCIPSDLGAFFMQQEMKARHGVAASHIGLGVAGFSGAASGGTIASMLAMLEDATQDPTIMPIMNDPYSLNPEGEQTGPDQAEGFTAHFDQRFDQWMAPFVMAGINTKVVRRSNALLDYAYGRDFRYDEGVLTGRGPLAGAKAAATGLGSVATMGVMAIGPIRRLISGRLPQPGDGPTKSQREKGYFDLLFVADHPSDEGKRLRGRVTGDRDPGYGSTSKMLAESAVCLARDSIEERGGFWTPASSMGTALLERLRKSAGLTFEITEG